MGRVFAQRARQIGHVREAVNSSCAGAGAATLHWIEAWTAGSDPGRGPHGARANNGDAGGHLQFQQWSSHTNVSMNRAGEISMLLETITGSPPTTWADRCGGLRRQREVEGESKVQQQAGGHAYNLHAQR